MQKNNSLVGEDEFLHIEISSDDCVAYRRLDQCLVKKIPSFSRTCIQRLIESGDISAEGLTLSVSKMPKSPTTLDIHLPPPIPTEAMPENIPLNIVYEDEHLLIINKCAGLVVHPAPGHLSGTLVNALLYHCQDLTGIGGERRPGIVHRLDKGTSGLMVVAETQATHEALVITFSTHSITRRYEALVTRTLESPAGRLESLIGRSSSDRKKMAVLSGHGKKAITHYKRLAIGKGLTHVELTLETGRTHQIRVHLTTLLKHPIIGDSLYGNPPQQLAILPENAQTLLRDYPHPLLHAKVLGFKHPITGEELHFEVPPPSLFTEVLHAALSA